MQKTPETRLRRTGFRTRLKLAVGLGAVLAASVVGGTLASAPVLHSAVATSHPASGPLLPPDPWESTAHRSSVSSPQRAAGIGPISGRERAATIGPISNR